MDNIFIVVILFGFLASLFGKSGKKKQPGQMPDFGGGGLPRTLLPQANGEQPERNEPQTVYRAPTEPERDQAAKRQTSLSTRADGASGAAKQAALLERALQEAAQQRQLAGQTTITKSVKQNDIRKAVVWAEILGPPRSKRPFGK